MLTVLFSSSRVVSNSTKSFSSSLYHKNIRFANSVSPNLLLSIVNVRVAVSNSDVVSISNGSPIRPTTSVHRMSVFITLSTEVVLLILPVHSISTITSVTAQSSFLTL